MKIDIFNEMLWPHFVQLNSIRKLPLNEQRDKYNEYLEQLAEARRDFIHQQQLAQSLSNGGNAGGSQPLAQREGRWLMNELGEYILDEEGNPIEKE